MTQAPLALVTGGLHRIGAAIAARLAADGYRLALHCRSDAEPEPALAVALATAGTSWTVLRADLSQPGAADALFDAATAHFGAAPAVLVNNASLFAEDTLWTLDEAQQAAYLAVNLSAPVRLARRIGMAALARGAPSKSASVVNILDQRIRNPVPDQIGYTVSKQALWQATRTLAVAMAPQVRVNAVAPGLTLPTADYEPGQMEQLAATMPLARLPTPADIAAAVAYLVAASSVTGQTLFVDGGAALRSFDRDFAYI